MMEKGQRATVAVLVGGSFLAVLNQTLLNPAIPAIMAETGVETTAAQWLSSGFTLVNAIVVAISAFLMDRFRTKPLFIVSFGMFLVGSLLAAWGFNFAILLIGRFLQAICTGVMLPMSMTVLLLIYPAEKRGSAMGVYNLVIMLAPAAGQAIAGVLTDMVGWHFMFLLMAILALVVMIFAVLFLKNYGYRKEVKLDKSSVTLSSAGLFCMLYGFSIFGSNFSHAILFIAAGAIVLVFFVRRQLRLSDPFLEVRVLGERRFRIGITIIMLVQACSATAMFLMPLYIQTAREMSATVSGLVLLPGSVIGAVMALLSGKLHDRFGVRYLSMIGVALIAIGHSLMAMFGEHTTIGFIVASHVTQSAGVMFNNTSITVWMLSRLPNTLLNHGNAVSGTLRQVAASIGTAIIISVTALATAASAGNGTGAMPALAGVRAGYLIIAIVSGIVFLLVNAFVRVEREGTSGTDLHCK